MHGHMKVKKNAQCMILSGCDCGLALSYAQFYKPVCQINEENYLSHFTRLYILLICMVSPDGLVSSRRIPWRWQTENSTRRAT
jgi:hypothetical protein